MAVFVPIAPQFIVTAKFIPRQKPKLVAFFLSGLGTKNGAGRLVVYFVETEFFINLLLVKITVGMVFPQAPISSDRRNDSDEFHF